jgi:hypothetical protein
VVSNPIVDGSEFGLGPSIEVAPEPTCHSCGVEWSKHLGIQPICRKLQEATHQNAIVEGENQQLLAELRYMKARLELVIKQRNEAYDNINTWFRHYESPSKVNQGEKSQ